MSVGRREAMADWLMVLAGLLLLASLFIPWSHQFSASMLAQYGSGPAVQGVAHDPDAWQVYSAVDVLLAALAGGLLVGALRGGRGARVGLLVCLMLAAAFTLHALSAPPTNGATLFDPALSPPGDVRNSPGAGPGETLALVALGLGLTGTLLSFTTDR